MDQLKDTNLKETVKSVDVMKCVCKFSLFLEDWWPVRHPKSPGIKQQKMSEWWWQNWSSQNLFETTDFCINRNMTCDSSKHFITSPAGSKIKYYNNTKWIYLLPLLFTINNVNLHLCSIFNKYDYIFIHVFTFIIA